jgi:hypothetical protein
MRYLALISGLIVIFAISLMLSGCSNKGDNLSKDENQQTQTEQLSNSQDKGTPLKLIALPAIRDNNTSAGVKEKLNKKKTDVKTEEKKDPEVKPETKNTDPRLADDTAMDPKNIGK